MPLARYGVCIGTLLHLDPSEQGTWYHGVFTVQADGQDYECTVDLESQLQDEVQYQILPNLRADLFQPILGLGQGYHDLARTPTSGALDYIRSPILTGQGCLTLWWGVWNLIFQTNLPWTTTDGQGAVNMLVTQISDPQAATLFVFGEPFTTGLGMHNVHMNQGDPPLSPDGQDHQPDDGIWQDGGTIIQHNDGTLHAFLSKFPTQSLNTNNQGLPI
ncbi:MAG TPA: DUF2278 family protein [Streptosporangiaceae bacterium]|nr:DUF2278 family protein [Streptosporangiaceae bacterium]